MHSPLRTVHRDHDERRLAVAVIAWLMLAGVCVLAANAWAMAV